MTTLQDTITIEQAWARLRDNEHVKRALEVALAENHNVMVMGREGDGKDLLDTIMGNQNSISPHFIAAFGTCRIAYEVKTCPTLRATHMNSCRSIACSAVWAARC